MKKFAIIMTLALFSQIYGNDAGEKMQSEVFFSAMEDFEKSFILGDIKKAEESFAKLKLGFEENQNDSKIIYWYFYSCYRSSIYSNLYPALKLKASNINHCIENLDILNKTDNVENQILTVLILSSKIHSDPLGSKNLYSKLEEFDSKLRSIEDENPRINLVKGLEKLYNPESKEKSQKKAISYFSAGVKYFEKLETYDSSKPNWGYLDLLIFLSLSLSANQKFDDALQNAKKIQKFLPEFKYINSILIPDLERKVKG
ncbi:hypothetical protein [Leptospira stimsonii]|uniref:Tetratricopeptide repeat protein n=1 Tax=Leptospira stimsonii TaxID=2202203 RepID=A0ABY2N3H5_9LEPT|nr:hypothetical protein [Leptospira stimsonii]TGK22039.1 hypothetical protein EHO98_07980 [Leptospira stimsonii]TGM14883.1 hypothetical protein EHQ90_10390 [Leptospira stimsonii]